MLNAKNAVNMRAAHSKTAYNTGGKKKGADTGLTHSLPEDAAQRWINQSKFNSDHNSKLTFGQKFKDASSKLLPP